LFSAIGGDDGREPRPDLFQFANVSSPHFSWFAPGIAAVPQPDRRPRLSGPFAGLSPPDTIPVLFAYSPKLKPSKKSTSS
jgi:hypothetical protein